MRVKAEIKVTDSRGTHRWGQTVEVEDMSDAFDHIPEEFEKRIESKSIRKFEMKVEKIG